MSLESDEKLVLATADKLIVHAGKLTQHDPRIAVAALGVAMMSIAKADDMTRKDIDELITIAEQGLIDA